MPRPKPSEPREKTVLFRVTERQWQVLIAVAHLDAITPNEYVHQLLVTHLAQVLRNPHVQADLANRAGYEAASASTVPIHAASASRKRKNSVESKQGSRRAAPRAES